MDRRGFLQLLAAALLIDPRELWVPGKKTIFIPAPRVVEKYTIQEMMAALDLLDPTRRGKFQTGSLYSVGHWGNTRNG